MTFSSSPGEPCLTSRPSTEQGVETETLEAGVRGYPAMTRLMLRGGKEARAGTSPANPAFSEPRRNHEGPRPKTSPVSDQPVNGPLTLSWAEGPVLTSQMVGTWLRLSAGRKSGVSAMSERESTDEEKMEALERSSRYEES